MDIRVDQNEAILEASGGVQEQQQPLLEKSPPPAATGKTPKTPAQKAIRKTFKGTALLSNLLPTGSVLIFQYLSPILTHHGQPCTPANHAATLVLLCFCAASCFLICFTDSFRDDRGKVRYGFATPRGLWVIDGGRGGGLAPEEAAERRIQCVDVLHAVLSVLVFAAMAVLDGKVVKCFYPEESPEAKRLLTAVPVGVGAVCGFLFLMFPTKRHGVGFPLSRR